MRQTKNCIICFKPAVVWTGHVHKGNEEILSGYCHIHRYEKKQYAFIGIRKNCIGCDGRFTKNMGIELTD